MRRLATHFALRSLLCFSAVLSILTTHQVFAVDTIWTSDADGTWNDAGAWSAGVPNGTLDAVIDDGDSSVTVTITATAATGNLTIGADDTLIFDNARDLSVAGGTINNAGLILPSSTGSATDLTIGVNSLISGDGVLRMAGSSNNNRIFGTAGTVLTNDSDHTIEGQGQLGVNLIGIINQGTIDANVDISAVPSASLSIDPSDNDVDGSGADFRNSANLQATNGGVLRLLGGEFNNDGGTIQAFDNSVVEFSGSFVRGGTLTTSGSGIVRFQSASTISDLTSSGLMQIPNAIDPVIAGIITNGGMVEQNSTGSSTDVRISGNTTVTGTGIWSMSDGVNNRWYGISALDILTNDTDHTIAGAGQLGVNLMGLVNKGLIDANQPTGLLVDPSDVDLEGSGSDVVNDGTMQASAGGTLRLAGGIFQNNGTIRALGGSAVSLEGSALIRGGVLTTTDDGVVSFGGVATLQDVAIEGLIRVPNGVDPVITGTITNNATVEQNSTGGSTDVRISGGTTLTGNGIWRMSDGINNRWFGISATDVLTNDTNHTITGAGQLGSNLMGLINNGLIDANQPTKLLVDPSDNDLDGNGADVVNESTMQASAGGTLELAGGLFQNNDVIQAQEGSTVSLTGSHIRGGTFSTEGTGVVVFTGASTIEDVTNIGLIQINNGIDPVVAGTITNNATIEQNSTGGVTDVRLSGSVTLSGTGVWTMSDQINNRIYGLAAADTLTNDVGHTIEGAGQIGANLMGLVNSGLIDANQPSKLLVDPSDLDLDGNGADVVNESTMQASDEGTLELAGGLFQNNKLIQALEGSTVSLTGSHIRGGTFSTQGDGAVIMTGSSTIEDVTNTGLVQINNGVDPVVVGTITNNATVEQNSTGGVTDVRLSGSVTLSGTGIWQMSNAANNRWYGFAATDILTNDTEHTLAGAGQLGANLMGLVNAGVIDANQATVLTIDPSDLDVDGSGNDVSNTGTLRGSGTGGLSLTGGVYHSTGTVEALDGSNVTYATSAATANNVAGVLTLGTWRAVDGDNGAAVTLRGAAITEIAADTTVELSGAAANINVAGTNVEDTLAVNNGTLKVLDGHVFNAMSATFTNNNRIELGGAGLAGGTFTASTATQLDNATGDSLITGHGTVGLTIANAGTVQSSDGTLTVLGNGIQGASGTIEVTPGSSLDLSGAAIASSADNLFHNGDDLNLGVNNIEVSVDYDNANFGVGNDFNHRANVSGSGLIFADPTVVQSLTGEVDDGGTATANMNFGNLHVGDAATKNYQVANTGAGPQLRGAIKTSADGGNLTDARLSGAGVTAANLGPVATGTNSGDLDVTFTATSAGALTGQQVRIDNNFDNVDTQLLTFTGAAYRFANPTSHTPEPVNFNNVHVGDAVPLQPLSITNDNPADGFSEGLNATIGATTGDATSNDGSFNLLAAGATDDSSLAVGLDTSTAGAKTGTATISLESDGAGTSELGTTALASQTVNVTGSVYRLASPSAHMPEPVNFGNLRVDDVVEQALSVTNDVPDDGFSESLNAVIGAATGDATAIGSFSLLGPGQTDNTSLVVTIDTSTAGPKTGTATISFESDGTGTSGLGTTALPSQTVTIEAIIEADVFRLADPSNHLPEPVDFGILHVGDAVEQPLSITNGAIDDGFSERLNARIGGATGDATSNDGSFNLLEPGQTDDSSLVVSVDTSTVGFKSGTATIELESDGTDTSGMGITALDPQTVNVSAQVNAFASAVVSQASGTGELTQTDENSYRLDLGSVVVGGDSLTAELALTNDVADPADDLAGDWAISLSGLTTDGFDSFSELAAGGTIGGLIVQLDTDEVGSFTGQAILSPRSENATGFSAALSDVTVTIVGEVAIPEPSAILLVIAGFAVVVVRRRRIL